MRQICGCGQRKDVSLHTVIYRGSLEIDSVPVYSCAACKHSEVFPGVKKDLTELIAAEGSQDNKVQLNFIDYHELAYLMDKALNQQLFKIPIDKIIRDRVNELLDLMILSRSLGDEAWIADIERKLRQITGREVYEYCEK